MTKAIPLPPVEYLNECLIYDPLTGKFIWKERPLRHFANEQAYKRWNKQYAHQPALATGKNDGYLKGSIDGVTYLAHRIAYKMVHNAEPKYVDHDDRNRQNNAAYNLKPSDEVHNSKNQSKHSTNTSGVTGVHFEANRGKWRAKLGDKKLGRYNSFEAAVEARAKAMAEAGYHPTHGT